jgi:fumarylacetoacetate (FAA) hydrolase family protein
LQAEGLWSQYLEVGIGPYAEVFTKGQPLSSVGIGAQVGILPFSEWNNPEPEVVLLVTPQAEVVGATLGNDVNLRDIEGRSALLLGKAKDNNASCAVGPFIRLFDDTFNLENVREMEVGLTIDGEDGYHLEEVSPMSLISRDVLDLVAQTIGEHHQYPDGLALFTGTLFAPTQDRGGKGMGFTHQPGDIVRISSPELGVLQNQVTFTHLAPPWKFGVSALMKNLGQRDLL